MSKEEKKIENYCANCNSFTYCDILMTKGTQTNCPRFSPIKRLNLGTVIATAALVLWLSFIIWLSTL